MQRSLHHALASLALTCLLAAPAFAAAPGYVDFGKLTAPKKGDFVEVNFGRGMLKFVSVLAKCKDPEAGAMIGGLSSVRVNVVGLDSGNREKTVDQMQTLRRDLAAQGWEQIVTARGHHDEDVAVYVKQRDDEVIEGVVVTVLNDRKDEAVFVNIVGQIKAEQLAAIGEHLDIRQLRDMKREGRG